MSGDSEFAKRDYGLPGDEAAIVYLWAKSYAHSRLGRALGAHEDASPAELKYWAWMREVVGWHIVHSRIEIICDSENPGTIYAFACTDGDVIHYVVLKRSAKQQGLTSELLGMLLGDRMQRPCAYTSDLVELHRTKTLPTNWYHDDHWTMRHMLKVAA